MLPCFVRFLEEIPCFLLVLSVHSFPFLPRASAFPQSVLTASLHGWPFGTELPKGDKLIVPKSPGFSAILLDFWLS